MDVTDIDAQAQEVSELLRAKLRVRGASLAVQSRKIGRLLPKKLKQDAAYLAQAQSLAANPKLMRMIDMSRVHTAHRGLVAHLSQIDPSDRRKGALLGTLGIVVFNLLVVFVTLIAVLRWRGLI